MIKKNSIYAPGDNKMSADHPQTWWSAFCFNFIIITKLLNIPPGRE
ncbi:MAG: hypothetical protein LBP31_02680 [Holosporales bacterium]|nr:hypothetical protein [Holosporales bacterium]